MITGDVKQNASPTTCHLERSKLLISSAEEGSVAAWFARLRPPPQRWLLVGLFSSASFVVSSPHCHFPGRVGPQHAAAIRHHPPPVSAIGTLASSCPRERPPRCLLRGTAHPSDATTRSKVARSRGGKDSPHTSVEPALEQRQVVAAAPARRTATYLRAPSVGLPIWAMKPRIPEFRFRSCPVTSWTNKGAALAPRVSTCSRGQRQELHVATAQSVGPPIWATRPRILECRLRTCSSASMMTGGRVPAHHYIFPPRRTACPAKRLQRAESLLQLFSRRVSRTIAPRVEDSLFQATQLHKSI
ncbi:hypothetical protein NDU88_003866 [Pleurodeles waltl]|uniref:Uncharacterized protein n=1 Tax=Pleurodeles waltl TaxID=8319 RepID=A0AAV7M6M2_PLEWA|nr:hypothetical protein NDU88_003866 [Pleurodeles waltl]